MYAKYKAQIIHISGGTVVEKALVPAVMKELEAYNGIYYADIEMNGLVLIEKKAN